jgi:chemotaxis response regulator CheB
MKKTRVLVVDDSALVRSLLTTMINAQQDMEAIGAASDPLQAREMIRNMNPDVLTLDIEMPRMDGLDFLEKLMRLRPMPVVMVSTLTARGAEVTMRALELGAVDFVTKPKIGISAGLNEAAEEITDKIRVASKARVVRRAAPPPGVSVEWRAGAAEIPARFDGRLLGRALRNLIENAAHAAEAAPGRRPDVELRAFHDAGFTIIEVADNGTGLPPEMRARVFDPLVTTKASGVGLGLTLVRRVAQMPGSRAPAPWAPPCG